MRRWIKIGLLLAVVTLLLAIVAGILYIRSDRFSRFVLTRVIQQIEQATGGKVEAQAFNWQLRPMQLELQGLVIHGLEGPGQPLFSADSIVIQLHIISLFRRQIDWRMLRATRPVIYLVVNPKGHTNFPKPKVKRTGANPIELVWALAVRRVEVKDGVFILNDERINLDFSANDVEAALNYRAATQDYTGHLSATTQIVPRPEFADIPPITLPADVQVDLLLRKNALEATSFTVRSGKSALTGSGILTPFATPVIDLAYAGHVDMLEAGHLAGSAEIRGGTIEVKGKFHYVIAEHTYTTAGDLRLERLALRGPRYNIPRVDGTAKYTLLNSDHIEAGFPAFHLYLFGGELTGRLHGDDIRKAFRVTASTQVHGLSVTRVLEMISTPDFPADRLPWAGAIEGGATAQFRLTIGHKNLRDLMVKTDVRVAPPSVTPPGLVPATGQVGLDYDGERDLVSFRNATLQTPGTRLRADGLLDVARTDRRTAVNLDAVVTNLAEWLPLLNAMRPGQPPLPLQVAGQVSFSGTAKGPLNELFWKGHLEAVNFTYNGQHWDRLAGDVAYSPDLLGLTNGQLARTGATAQFDLSAELQRGKFTDTSAVTLDARLQNVAVSDLQSLAGTNYPLNGVVNANMRVTGTRANPRGSGLVTITRGTLAGEPFDILRADLALANQELQANNMVLRRGASSLTGQAAYRQRDKHYRFQLTGANIPLTDVTPLQSERLALTGMASFQASGEGTLERPSINADVRLSNVTLNGEQLGTVTARVETREGEAVARIQTQFLRGNLVADVSVRLEGNFPGQARLEFTGIDLDPLLSEPVRQQIVTHTLASGLVTVSGPFKEPEKLSGRADVTDFHIALQQGEFHNVGPMRALYQNGVIRVDQAHLEGPKTDVNVTGTVKVTGPPAARVIALKLDGSVNLALISTLQPDLDSWGQMLVSATVSGTLAHPQLGGRAEFRGGNIALRDIPTGLSNLRGTVTFNAQRIQVENLTADIGGGPITLTGFVNYGVGELPVFRLTAVANGIRIRYPQGTSSTLDAKLQLTGTTASSQLSGDVTVTRMRFDPQFDLARTLGGSREPIGAPSANPVLANMRLNVRLSSSPEMRFEFAQARNVQLEANLSVRGSAARPALLGRISLLAGEVTFAGTNYEVNRGDISFVNPFKIEPTINLSLSTRVQQYDIAIDLSGSTDRLNVSYRSDPPLPSTDIQVMLLTGQTRQIGSATPPPTTVPQLGANTILSQALNTAVTSRIERIFGVSQLKIDPQFGGPETTPGARVLLQQQITQDVRFTYIQNLAQTQQLVFQVEWQINERWSVVAVRDENGLFGIDLRWRKRFK